MGPIERLELNKNNLTKSEIEIMEYIKKNPMDIVQFSIIQIAEKANTSKSAVIRLCQKIGDDGFSEFKFDISTFCSPPKTSSPFNCESVTNSRLYTLILTKFFIPSTSFVSINSWLFLLFRINEELAAL